MALPVPWTQRPRQPPATYRHQRPTGMPTDSFRGMCNSAASRDNIPLPRHDLRRFIPKQRNPAGISRE